jgi:hypothetical protein
MGLLAPGGISSVVRAWLQCGVITGFGKEENFIPHDQMIEHPDIDHFEDLG